MMTANATKTAKRATPAKKPVSPAVRAMLAKIHIARKDLDMEDGDYRDLLEQVTEKRSAAELTYAQLNNVLEEFKRLGWEPVKKKTGPKRAGGRALAEGGQAGKIRALWMNLYHLALIRDPSEKALAAFVKRTTGVAALQWLDERQADKAINALRGWLTRKGFVFPDAERQRAVEAWRHAAGLPVAPAGFAEKIAVMESQWQRIKDSGTMEHAFFAALGQWCAKNYGAAAPYFLSPEKADKAIEQLGRWVRKATRETKS